MSTPKTGGASRDGNWMDAFGACKVCNGEIPHGHANNCDIYKLEMEVATERTAREKAEALLAQKDQIYLERLDAFEQLAKRVLAAEAKSGDVAKALNAYPDSDLVSLATTLEATRHKAEVVFPLVEPGVNYRMLCVLRDVKNIYYSALASPDFAKAFIGSINMVALEKELLAAESAAPGVTPPDIEVLNNALNNFSMVGGDDDEQARAARQSLFELRDRLEKQTPGENLEVEIKTLKYAASLCDSKNLLFKNVGYRAACDEIKTCLLASVERLEAGEQMESTATVTDARKTEGAK